MTPTYARDLRICLVGFIIAAGAFAGGNSALGLDADSPEVGIIGSRLSAQVAEIGPSRFLSPAEKARRISAAVQTAVVTATGDGEKMTETFAIARQLVHSAAAAAPEFAAVIADAALSAPAVARIDGVQPRLRLAAITAAMQNRRGSEAHEPSSAQVGTADLPQQSAPTTSMSSSTAVTVNSRSYEEPAMSVAEYSRAGSALSVSQGSPAKDETSRFTLSATGSLRFDDNIYLTSDNEAEVAILTVAPGIRFDFGLRSAAQGSLSYQHALVRYEGEPLPDASLGSGSASLTYDGGKLTLSGNASYEQINENTSATAGLGSQLFQRDLLNIGIQAETPVTAKINFRGGAEFNKLKYESSGLVGTRDYSFPIRFLYETTPKARVGLGATYRNVDPQGAGPSGRDWYYNVSATGDFTAKLSGDVSVGYRTRDVAGNSIDDIWGFDGSLRYIPTVKTAVAIRMSRDFGTGALGESLVSDRYSLSFSADPTLQWSFGAVLGYTTSDYGPAVFANTPFTVARSDDFWAATFSVSYLINAWFSAIADFTHRTSDSTTPSADYSNNQFNLTLGLSY